MSRPKKIAKKSASSRKSGSWRTFWVLSTLLTLGLLVGALTWLQMPMGFKALQAESNPSAATDVLDLTIEPGTSPRGVARAVVSAGADVSPQILWIWFRLSGQDRAIKAGSYEITPEMSPKTLLNMLARGEESLRSITLVEGWTFKQFRQALAKADTVKYTYSKGATDISLMKRALKSMDQHLGQVWSEKRSQTILKTPDELLILASIVEKETGRAVERPMISAVFHNRLKIGMRLQTDPTVIYGLGDAFDGNLRKVDLKTDTPYNTYTRSGLPPTPIAMPGKAAMLAAIAPSSSTALYFVARGDGSSYFSQSLNEHNQAVNRYQRGISVQGK